MAALGPEDCATKIELAALKRAKEQDSVLDKRDPDTRMAVARERVSRLEKALTALGDFDGVEVESLRAALKRAQKEAQEVPFAVQIREREAFIERAKERIAGIDEERQAEVRCVEEAEHKLKQLRDLCTTQQEQPGGLTVADSGAEVQRFQAIVVELQRLLEHSGGPATVVGANAGREIEKRFRAQLCGGDAAVVLGQPTGFAGSHHGGEARGGGKNLPVVVSRRPRAACRAHGCFDERVRSKHVAVYRGSHGATTGQQSGGDAPLPQQVVDICVWRTRCMGSGGSESRRRHTQVQGIGDG